MDHIFQNAFIFHVPIVSVTILSLYHATLCGNLKQISKDTDVNHHCISEEQSGKDHNLLFYKVKSLLIEHHIGSSSKQEIPSQNETYMMGNI